MKPIAICPICIFVLLVAGCGTKSADPSGKVSSSGPKLIQIAGLEGVQVDPESLKLAGITIETAGNDRLAATMQPTGEVQPTDSGTIQVTSRLPGKITQALVSVGERVHEGQILAYVDSVDLAQAEANYQTAVSHANLAKNQLEQQRKLAGFGSLSEQPVEDAKKAAAAADAAVASDEAQIKVDRLALQSTRQLVEMGEITRKPLEDAQNAYAQAQASATQAANTLHSTKSSYDRAVILFNGGIFSRQQLEDAETAYNSAVASDSQAKTAERLAREELTRQETIYNRNLNGAGSLQGAQSKLQQDEHTYQNDLVAQELAHKQYQRALTVHKSGIPISQALLQAQDTYDAAMIAEQAAASTLRIYGVSPGSSVGELRNGRVVIPITSPIEGIVAARNMVAGQNVDTTVNLVKLINLDRVYIDAQVYERDVQGVAVGDSVQVHVAAMPNKTLTGKVKWVSDEINPDTRTATVRTILDNPSWSLRPGMFASVTVGSKKSVRSIAIPVDAVMQEADKQIVYVQVSPGQFCKREVTVGEQIGGKLPIHSGLSPGDQVVVGGNVFIQKEQELLEAEKAGAK
ncbi:MAG: efflux RND transporter periplasmic adaptor subunit [Fimbriimonadales bacterium]